MEMKKTFLVVMLTAAVCPGLLQATPASYVGKLACWGTSADGSLSVSSVGPYAGWLSSITSVGWQVDNIATPGLWHYTYTIKVHGGGDLSTDIQCVIIETTPTFSWDNLDSVATTPAGWLSSTQIDTFKRSENVDLPSNVYGIMFCTRAVDPTTLTISFDSDRAPVWGDMYARSFTFDGQYNTLYNSGWEYNTDDNDPTDPPSNGSILDHVLVPGSQSTGHGEIPAPGAMLLGTVGATLVGWLGRKRRL